MATNWTADERARLEQELLELHFDCHPEPETLEARLRADAALRALQVEVLATAAVLQEAASGDVPVEFAPPVRRPWFRRATGRLSVAAAAALFVVGAAAAHLGLCVWERDAAERAERQVTVSAPRAVPPGAPWSLTLESVDLDGNPVASEVSWRVVGGDERDLARGVTTAVGRSVVAMAAGLAVPARIEIDAAGATVPHRTLSFESTVAPPLVHVTTDRPVYRPGEPVYVRAVALERCSLVPAAVVARLRLTIRDAHGGLLLQENRYPVAGPGGGDAPVAAWTWTVPAESAGGEHTIAIEANDGSIPTERTSFVVRSYETPRLVTEIVLDRKTYVPGERGSAEVSVRRLGGDVAAGAQVHGVLRLDGDEVFAQDAVLDATGRATFRFVVPEAVRAGAALFVARVVDGGIVESDSRPFVVPTGEVLAAAYPEGGMLVAGVENRLYVELQDPLGRPVDGGGVVESDRGELMADFVTAHQGRARVAFTPHVGGRYRLRCVGMVRPLELPEPQERGIALRLLGDGVAAGEPVRVALAGRGDGPWLVGAFCRGVLLAQATVDPDANGAVSRDVALELPAEIAGIVRVTVFDRTLQPVAERLVQRAMAQRVALDVAAERPAVAPGDRQTLRVTARDEQGQPLAGAVLGIRVADAGALAMATEPSIGLEDQLRLFGDCERIEDLGDFLLADVKGARNVDLLLGTRGWRRFVWRNDDAAKAAIAKAGDWGQGQLAREGFAQEPQVVSNRAEALAAVASVRLAATQGHELLRRTTGFAILLLLLGGAVELALWLRRQRLVPPWVCVTGLAGAALVVVILQVSLVVGRSEEKTAVAMAAFAPRGDGVQHFAAVPPEGIPVGRDEFFLGAHRRVAARDLAAGVGGDRPAGQQPAERGNKAPAGGRGPAAAGPAGPSSPGPGGPVRRLAPPAVVREYSHHNDRGARRDDFTATICWQPVLVTDARGEASVSFDTSDAVTTWRAHVDAFGAGRVGQADGEFAARLPFHVEVRLPVEVSAGDRLLLPVAIERTDGGGGDVALSVRVDGPLMLQGLADRQVALTDGRGRELVEVAVGPAGEPAGLEFAGRSGRFDDRVARQLAVVPRGYPHERSFGGTVRHAGVARVRVAVPEASVPGSGELTLRVFPSPLAGMLQGLDGILQEPRGCFEQASSSNYPNVMVLGYLEAAGDDVPAVAARARELLPRGYAKITGYECRERGYEWFGGDPGHEALTAYGLLQFHDMGRVHDVDAGMVRRTQEWLLQRRDGNGGYRRNGRALDSFGRAPDAVTAAYVTLALLESGVAATELEREVRTVAERAAVTEDAYELALCAGAMARAGHDGVAAARTRLAAMQAVDGSLTGRTTSITSSGGRDLTVETTAWATLAWLGEPEFSGAVRRGVEFLQGCRSANGRFGATQATICALRALSGYALASRVMPAAGTVIVRDGDRVLGQQAFQAGQVQPVVFALWSQLAPGDHELEIALTSAEGVELPWAMDLGYHTELPADDPDGAVAIATKLLADRVAEGGTVGLEVRVQNRRPEGQPMALARVGLPAGLEVSTRVLDDRRKAGEFDLWELRGRELVFYWRSLAPAVERTVHLECAAVVPGTTTGAASHSYLYYTPTAVRWAAPLRIEVTPAEQAAPGAVPRGR